MLLTVKNKKRFAIFSENSINRFNSKINRTETCWVWSGHLNKDGYGMFTIKTKEQIGAHVASYLIHKGDIADDACVCHSCDNPSCVNPDHLWLGTHQENMKDMKVKKRARCIGHNKGENMHLSKLKERDIIDIRAKAASGILQNAIAKEFNVSTGAISLIVNRKNWKHI